MLRGRSVALAPAVLLALLALVGGCGGAGSPPAPASAQCIATTEVCNGLDDDCDGTIDEGFVLDSSPACADATLLGAVRGDSSDDNLSASDWPDAWFRVQVTDDSAAQGGFLGVMVMLTANFPRQVLLEVHCPSCGGAPFRTAAGGPGMMGVVLVGKEDVPGVDDSFEMLIHVAESGFSAGCGLWQLGVRGDPSVNRTTWTCP